MVRERNVQGTEDGRRKNSPASYPNPSRDPCPHDKTLNDICGHRNCNLSFLLSPPVYFLFPVHSRETPPALVVPTIVPPVTTGVTLVPTLPMMVTGNISSLHSNRLWQSRPVNRRSVSPRPGSGSGLSPPGILPVQSDLREGCSRWQGTGTRFYQIPARNEIVEAAIQKQDGSGNPLTVEIYNDGVLAGNATTKSPNGAIDLHTNLRNP